MICLFQWPEITSTIKYKIFTDCLISSKLSIRIFIARFYSRWLVQYLCRLWGSHPGPVHTPGISRPLLACRLSQGNDGGGDGGYNQIYKSCSSVPSARCFWTRPTLVLSEMGKLSVRKTTPGRWLFVNFVKQNCVRKQRENAPLIVVNYGLIQFCDRKIWYLLIKKISLWQFEN